MSALAVRWQTAGPNQNVRIRGGNFRFGDRSGTNSATAGYSGFVGDDGLKAHNYVDIRDKAA